MEFVPYGVSLSTDRCHLDPRSVQVSIRGRSVPSARQLEKRQRAVQVMLESMTEEDRAEFEERMALGKIAHCMASYRDISALELHRQRRILDLLPHHHRFILPQLAHRVEVRLGGSRGSVQASLTIIHLLAAIPGRGTRPPARRHRHYLSDAFWRAEAEALRGRKCGAPGRHSVVI